MCKPRRFWIRPGRTRTWWDKFVNDVVVPEEWRENFRMKLTHMRPPIEVERQVAVTLYYLSDEGWLRKTANVFGLSRSSVFIILRRVCRLITIHLGSKYIRLPRTEDEVRNLVKQFSIYTVYHNVLGQLMEHTYK